MQLLSNVEILKAAYLAFNARNIDAVLALMRPDVDWPNGMEGGRVHGHADVRSYWSRQWKALDPHVEPREFHEDKDGRIVVEVHQVVRDLAGNILVDRSVHHAYSIRGGLIHRMDILERADGPQLAGSEWPAERKTN